jgi:hypothetical protein
MSLSTHGSRVVKHGGVAGVIEIVVVDDVVVVVVVVGISQN